MTEGYSVTASAARNRGADAGYAAAPPSTSPGPGATPGSRPYPLSASSPARAAPAPGPAASAPMGAAPLAATTPASLPVPHAPAPRAAARQGREGPEEAPHVRVDARLIESAILGLRKPIAAASLALEAAGVEQARAQRRNLLSQIDDYLLPRLREPGSPILVALVGSTGAGKSTLVNSLVGAEVSMTGIRRPTTNSPVLACHPGDVDWFAENVFLPTVPRVRQEGLARSGRDGLLVLAASEGMPKGIALLDTPDIDSVVQAHREFAHQFLDASDLWLFMTTASRYADATVWDLLQHARDRGAALGLVLSRVPQAAAEQLVGHFDAMLEANGLGDKQRFLIPETMLSEGKLPPAVSGPVRDWLERTAAHADRRIAVLTQTMSGVLDTFRARVPALAAEVEAQTALRADLTAAVAGAYQVALADVDTTLQDGSLLRGEVLARWQDLAGTGDLLRVLQTRRGRGKQRHHHDPDRAQVLKLALREAIESLIMAVAGRAAEESVARWQDHPAGAALMDQSRRAVDAGWSGGSQFAAQASEIFGLDAAPASGRHVRAPAGEDGPAALGRPSPDLATRAARAVSAWQDHVVRLVRAENITKRSIARAVSFDDESLAIVLMIGLLGTGQSEGEGGISAIPQRLLTSLFGAGPLREATAGARADLRDRISLILDEEMLRFTQLIESVGVPDSAVAVQLYQATYALEVVR